MSRLPKVGGDNNTWGNILNDFLAVEHNADGTQKTLGLAKGGTGAANAASARSNLGAVSSSDSRLTDSRTPTDGSVTDAKVSASASIAVSKLAPGSNGQFLTTTSGTATWGAAPEGIVFNVKDYGAIGDGVTDDTAAIQAAITAAEAQAGTVFSVPGKTYLVSALLTVAATCRLHFSDSTLKKAASHSGAALAVSGNAVELRNLVINNNRSAGAGGGTGVLWTGADGRAYDSESSHCDGGSNGIGWSIQSDRFHGYRLRAVDCVNTGLGIAIYNPDCIIEDAYVDTASYAGIYIGAAHRTRVSGKAHRCGSGFLAPDWGALTDVDVPWFLADDCDQFGLQAYTLTRGHFGRIECRNIGHTASNDAGTGIEFYGCWKTSLDSYVGYGQFGYDVALATDGTNGCREMNLGSIFSHQDGASNSDPAVIISGGSCDNHIDTLRAYGRTCAIFFGDAAGDNNRNVVGLLSMDECWYDPIIFDNGSHHNHIGRVVARNCFVVPGVPGIVQMRATASYNTIGFLDLNNDKAPTSPCIVAPYLMDTEVGAQHNDILGAYDRGSGSITAVLNDPSGTNRVIIV